jgi:hypothetical protein
MGLFHSPRIVTDNIRCCLDAGNPSSYSGTGTAWNDISGFGNNFTNSNVTYNADGYFTYNGTNSQTIGGTPNSFSADNNSSSVGVWFRPHTVSPAANMAVFTDNFGPEYGIWVLTGGNATGYATGGVGGPVSANEWVYFCFTVTSGVLNTGSYTLKSYINGSQVGSTTTGTVGNGLNDWPITLGYDSQNSTNTNHFDGDIAIVQFYQSILSAEEVQQNFNAHRKRFGV